jgi:PKHD-type hydroxylase
MISSKISSELLVEKCFTDKECDEIISYGADWIEGTIQKLNCQLPDKERRSVLISKENLPEELIQSLYFKIMQINQKTFRYHIEGFVLHDLPRIFKYSHERNDHYTWHRDTLFDPNNQTVRKLSFSIQLTNSDEYEGGDLEFMPQLINPLQRQKGFMIVFPPYLVHRVTPITKGVRHVIVGWIHGPSFR